MQLHILDMVTGDKLYPYVDVEVTLLNAGVSTILLKGNVSYAKEIRPASKSQSRQLSASSRWWLTSATEP